MTKATHGILTESAHRVQWPNTADAPLNLDAADWEDLRLFQTVVRCESYRAAARQEAIAVNTVRARMTRLEEQLGQMLMHRTTRGITLTDAGQALARATAEMSDAALRACSSEAGEVLISPGHVRIGCSEGLGTLWLTPRVAELEAELAGITVDLQYDYDLARYRTNEADIWLTFEQPKRQDFIVSKIATLHFLPFVSEHYIKRNGAPVSVDDLKQHRIIEHYGPGVRSDLLDFLIGTERPHGLISLRTNSSLAQLWAVAQGLGIGGLPTYVAEITRAVAPTTPVLHIRRELRIAYHESGKRSPAIRKAIAWLRGLFDHEQYPCFADAFVHPDDFPSRTQDGRVAELFLGLLDRMQPSGGVRSTMERV